MTKVEERISTTVPMKVRWNKELTKGMYQGIYEGMFGKRYREMRRVARKKAMVNGSNPR